MVQTRVWWEYCSDRVIREGLSEQEAYELGLKETKKGACEYLGERRLFQVDSSGGTKTEKWEYA